MADDLRGFARKLDAMAESISGPALKRTLDKVGAKGKQEVSTAVTATLGDQSMSNWRRGRPIQITGRYNVVGDSIVEILPSARAAGPMRVLNEGRKAGVSKGRRGRAGRPVSATAGKHTWDHAATAMGKSLPRVVEDAVRDSLRNLFGG